MCIVVNKVIVLEFNERVFSELYLEECLLGDHYFLWGVKIGNLRGGYAKKYAFNPLTPE